MVPHASVGDRFVVTEGYLFWYGVISGLTHQVKVGDIIEVYCTWSAPIPMAFFRVDYGVTFGIPFDKLHLLEKV